MPKSKIISLTEEEIIDLGHAINFWRNYIQTGDINTPIEMVESMIRHARTDRDKIEWMKKRKQLSSDQMKKLLFLEELQQKLLKS